jgi:hypothetical protein
MFLRLSHRVFITDGMNTLFFKSSSQITVAEMCGDLPSTDAMFETANSTEYERLVATPADLGIQGGSLKDLVTLSLGESWSGPGSASSTSVGTEHLMSLIFGWLPRPPDRIRLLLIIDSPPFHHLCVAHRAPPLIDATNPGARHESLERALASSRC